jgi:hypothetical protein
MPLASIDMIPEEEPRGQSVLVRIDAEDETKLRDSLATLALVPKQADARFPVNQELELSMSKG